MNTPVKTTFIQSQIDQLAEHMKLRLYEVDPSRDLAENVIKKIREMSTDLDAELLRAEAKRLLKVAEGLEAIGKIAPSDEQARRIKSFVSELRLNAIQYVLRLEELDRNSVVKGD